MTATQLRAAFDRLPILLADRLNALIDAMGLYAEEEEKHTVASLIATGLEEGHSLEQLFAEVESGVLAHRLSVDGERTLHEVIAALEGAVSLPDGFSDLRAYIDAPHGEVAEGETLPVSGDSVFHHVEDAEARVRSLIPPTEGAVAQGETLPVSGDCVFRAIKGAAEPLHGRISALESAAEGIPFHFETVTTDEICPTVPSGVLPYARIDSLGGRTRACRNLLRLKPNTELEAESYVGWPFTASVDEEGYLTIDSEGTDTSVNVQMFGLSLSSTPSTVTVSARYIGGTALASPESGDSQPFIYMFNSYDKFYLPTDENRVTTLTLSNCKFYSTWSVAGCFTDYKVALQVEEGTTATGFEPYFEGLKSAKVTAVKSYGKNLYDGEAEIALNGAEVSCVLCRPNIEGTTHFSFKKDITSGNAAGIFQVTFTDGTVFLIGKDTLSTELTFTKKIKSIALKNYALCVGRVYDIQLERGSKATDYSPYVGLIDTYTVPSEVQALEGYGIGISTTSNNGIDFANKTYTNRNGITTVSPSLSWGRTASASPLYWTDHGIAGVASFAEIYCNTYKGTPRGAYDGDAGDRTISLAKTRWYILDTTIADHNALKTVLTENPTFVVYSYESPTTTDISEHITVTPYLKVESGGHLEAVSEDGVAATLTMTYQIKNEQ